MPQKFNLRDDYDGARKDVIETYLQEFLDFFFPTASAQIDWARGYRFLDKELQKITPRSALRKGVVDKLFEAYSKDGSVRLLAVHLEAQNERIEDLPERVYQYNYRIYERLHRPVASLVLLTDTHPDWRPTRFESETLGCKITLEFPMAKLSDFDTPELAAHSNVFSFVIRAHRRAQASCRTPRKRYDLRMALTEELAAAAKVSEAETNHLQGALKFIEWVMRLPDEMEDEFLEDFTSRHQEESMFVRYAERKFRAEARAEGHAEGLAEAVLRVLVARFGQIPDTLRDAVSRVRDISMLDQLIGLAVTCTAVNEFEGALSETPNQGQ